MIVNMPAISIITPMYNAKKYIKQAIDSALNQTFADIEIIIIDDCSTDGSYELCQSLYGNNERVVLLHNEKNLGCSLTENRGLRLARGKYIAILEADDAYLPETLEALYNIAEKEQADVVSAIGWFVSNTEEIPTDFQGLSIFNPDGLPVVKEISYLSNPSDHLKTKLDKYLSGAYGFACCWNKLYLKSFLMKNNIFFTKYAADRFFTFRCMVHAEKYLKVPLILNVYRNLSVSDSRQPLTIERLKKMVNVMNGFASEFDNYMNDIDFFIQNPEYRFGVLERQLFELDSHDLMKFYPNGQSISLNVLDGANSEIEKIFGDNAPLVKWLFHHYHMFFRQLSNLKIKK